MRDISSLIIHLSFTKTPRALLLEAVKDLESVEERISAAFGVSPGSTWNELCETEARRVIYGNKVHSIPTRVVHRGEEDHVRRNLLWNVYFLRHLCSRAAADISLASEHEKPRVFVSYVRENDKEVDRLVRQLEAAGISTWIDRNDIKPGEPWPAAIEVAISTGAFFLACFSSASEQKDKSYMREELRVAIAQLRLRPERSNWFIPIRLDESEVPNLRVGPGETLRDRQFVDLADDWEVGVFKLVSTLTQP